jgi:hypothetical protein
MKWTTHRQRSFPIELYDDPPAWEYALKQFIARARSVIPSADIIHVMVTGEVEDDREE